MCAAYDRNLTTEGRGAALLLGFEQLSLQAPIWLKAMLAHDLLQMPTFTSYVNYATSSKEARKQIRVRIEATRHSRADRGHRGLSDIYSARQRR